MRPVPKFRRVADALIAEMRRGTRPPGSRLPTQRELTDAHGWATGVRARKALVDEGWAVAVAGSGLFVPDVLPADPVDVQQQLREHERRISLLEQQLRELLG